MLTEIDIQNFRCFESVKVPLGPLTVLVGPNDTGKSAFLDAVMCLGGKQGNLFDASDVRMVNGSRCSSVRIVATDDQRPHVLQVNTAVSTTGELSPHSGNNYTQSELQRFHIPSTGVKTECPGFGPQERAVLALNADGNRTAAVLDHIFRIDMERRSRIVAELRRLVPGCSNIVIETPEPATRRIDLVVEGNHQISASQSSAGVRMLLFFLALVHHPILPKVVLIEEPETGIHPRRLDEVMKLLRGLTTGAFGGDPVQVILTTHSPYLLDCVNPSTDQVLIFQRNPDGSRSAQPANREHLNKFFDGFMLGEVWFNAEEAGLIGAR